jgi:hypothetical protein
MILLKKIPFWRRKSRLRFRLSLRLTFSLSLRFRLSLWLRLKFQDVLLKMVNFSFLSIVLLGVTLVQGMELVY